MHTELGIDQWEKLKIKVDIFIYLYLYIILRDSFFNQTFQDMQLIIQAFYHMTPNLNIYIYYFLKQKGTKKRIK